MSCLSELIEANRNNIQQQSTLSRAMLGKSPSCKGAKPLSSEANNAIITLDFEIVVRLDG
jgi:hypothetical protein